MKLNRKSRGVIHYFALIACLLALFAIFFISQWIKKIDNLSNRLTLIEKNIEGLESKIKYLDLKMSADELVKHDKIDSDKEGF